MHQGKFVRCKDWSVSTIGSFSDTNLGANIIHLFLSQYDRFFDWEESLHFTGMKTDSTPARVTPRRIKGATWRFNESPQHSSWLLSFGEEKKLLYRVFRPVETLRLTVVGRGIPAARPHAETVPLCFIWVDIYAITQTQTWTTDG